MPSKASMDGRYPIQTDERYPVEESERVRVGDPESIVLPGDINPENSMPYRSGQFAPSPEELSETMMRAAVDAGLLPNDLPIYEDGLFSQELFDNWEPAGELKKRGVGTDEDVPKYVDTVVLTSLMQLGDRAKKSGLSHITAGSREDARGIDIGVIIIAARNRIQNGKFTGWLEIYPDFHRFITVPLSPRVPGEATGVSVASYAVLHAIGHLIYAKLGATGDLAALSSVLGGRWVKNREAEGFENSHFLGSVTSRVWKRDARVRAPSALAKASPGDEFAEIFALYFTNKDYLRTMFPEEYDAIEELFENDVL